MIQRSDANDIQRPLIYKIKSPTGSSVDPCQNNLDRRKKFNYLLIWTIEIIILMKFEFII